MSPKRLVIINDAKRSMVQWLTLAPLLLINVSATDYMVFLFLKLFQSQQFGNDAVVKNFCVSNIPNVKVSNV